MSKPQAPADKVGPKKTAARPKVTRPKAATASKAGLHGVALVERVIERVRADGFEVLGSCGVPRRKRPAPVPTEALERLAFPSGAPLSPSLRRWLAFDAAWLGWFADPRSPVFAPLSIGDYATQEYGMSWGYEALQKKLLPGACYGLHFGADSRRFLYVGEPDSAGEHPVLLIDTDDVPYIGVEYPGIDVYLGIHSGVLDAELDTYGSLSRDARYRARMKEHADHTLGGREGFELYNDVNFDDEGNPIQYVHLPKGMKPPPDAVAGKNPLTGETIYFRRVPLQ